MTAPVEYRASRPEARRWPGGSWVGQNKVLATLIPVLLAVLLAVLVVGVDGGKTASRLPAASKSAVVLPATTKGAKWLTGPAGKLLAAVNIDLGKLGAAQRAGQPGVVKGVGVRLAADTKAALGGPMPPADATIYRVGLNNLRKAGAQISSGNSSPVGTLLAAGNGDIATVTAAANRVAPAQVSEPQG
ncbi:MAG: hypothetical protein ABSB59_33665 [Streptosporangiaceae bacterium]